MRSLILLFLMVHSTWCQAVKTIHTDELLQILPFSLVIDVRSPSEYAIAHIKGAINVPLSSQKFQSKVINLLSDGTARQLILYGNNPKQAQTSANKVSPYIDSFVYNKNFAFWLKKHPQYSRLFSKRINPKTDLISERNFRRTLLAKNAFIRKARGGKTLLIQGDAFAKHSKRIKTQAITLRKFVSRLESKEYKETALYLSGLSVEQSRWVQYALNRNGIKSYSFLK